MQFDFEPRSAKKLARALEKFLSTKGVTLAHGQALDALAAMQGHSDWNSLSASLKPEAINELLDAFELAHIDANSTTAYENEGELRTHTGFALRFPLHETVGPPQARQCGYVRTVDPLGREIAYWCSNEWRDDPETVMGAIIGSLVRGHAIAPKQQPERSKLSAPRVEGTINLYVGTYCKADYFPVPQWAKIELTQSLLDELLHLRELAIHHDLESVTRWGSPQWQECAEDDEEALRMDAGQLYVRSDRFWYQAYPKHTDDVVETVGVDFTPLLKAIAGETSEEFVRHGNDIVWGGYGLVEDLLEAGEALSEFPQTKHTDRVRCPDCGIPTIEDADGLTEIDKLCNRCAEARDDS